MSRFGERTTRTAADRDREGYADGLAGRMPLLLDSHYLNAWRRGRRALDAKRGRRVRP